MADEDDWRIEDNSQSIQAQMHEIDRMLLRATLHKRMSKDSKVKIYAMLDDIKSRFENFPDKR